jgi:RimJ/RimL family protein N-acetyltransferase
MIRAPTIETQRLRLRARELDDFPAFAALQADADFHRFINGAPVNEPEAWAKFLAAAGAWALLGHGYWIVEDKESGVYLGDAGVSDFRRAIEPPLGAPEAGWGFAPATWGKGVATEAMSAVMGWCDEHLDAPEVCCIIDPGHAASIGVARKVGFTPHGSAVFKGKPTLVLRRARKATTRYTKFR